MTEEKSIYNLELHEVFSVYASYERFYVQRVPGGWIYRTATDDSATGTFVPYDNEFNPN